MEKLYHYTSVGAFHSILTKPKLRFTDFRFLNDSSEVSYGFRLIRMFVEKFGEKAKGQKEEFVKSILTRLDIFELINHPYVACFSEKEDDLNQWRSYTEQSGRVCLEFDPKILTIDDPHFNIRPQFMEYDPRRQVPAIRKELRTAFEERKQMGVDNAAITCLFRLSDLALGFKHPAFEDEAEWRLIATRKHEVEGKLSRKIFEPRRFGLTPYIEVPISLDALVRVHIGPAQHQELHRKATIEFLGEFDLDRRIKVVTSNIPFR